MPKAKTLRKRRYIKNTLDRTVSSWAGAGKILQLLARADKEIIVGDIGVNHLQRITNGSF